MIVNNKETPGQTNDPFAPLYRHQFALLTTFRKNGVGVPTVVWFAPKNGKLYVMTIANTGKVKRIRNNARVQLAPSTNGGKVLGEQIEGRAHLLPATAHQEASATLAAKYGFLYRLFKLFGDLRKTNRTFIEIAPI